LGLFTYGLKPVPFKLTHCPRPRVDTRVPGPGI